MAQIDVLKAQINRPDVRSSWGFSLQGGVDYGQAVMIQKIAPDSPAGKIGLLVGDEVTQVGDVNTASLTHAQVVDLVSQYTTTLILTIERPAGAGMPHPVMTPRSLTKPVTRSVVQHDTSRSAKSYQTYDMSGAKSSPAQSGGGGPYHTPQYDQRYMEGSQALREGDVQHGRTFKHLRNLMENESPPAGSRGLPPPRSAEWEKCKDSQRDKYGDKRVKVFMPQQYNSPMGLYSPPNVMESFSTQAEGVFEELDRKRQIQEQRHASAAQKAVTSQQFQLPQQQ